MDESYAWEVYEMFRDQLKSQLPIIDENILLLESGKTSTQALNELLEHFILTNLQVHAFT